MVFECVRNSLSSAKLPYTWEAITWTAVHQTEALIEIQSDRAGDVFAPGIGIFHRVSHPMDIIGFPVKFTYFLTVDRSRAELGRLHRFVSSKVVHKEDNWEFFINRASSFAHLSAIKALEDKRRMMVILIKIQIHEIVFVDDHVLREMIQSMQNRGVRIPAAASSIEALETKKFDEEADCDETCTICFDEFRMGLDIMLMPCSHFFHKHCLVNWLRNKNSCPLCQTR